MRNFNLVLYRLIVTHTLITKEETMPTKEELRLLFDAKTPEILAYLENVYTEALEANMISLDSITRLSTHYRGEGDEPTSIWWGRVENKPATSGVRIVEFLIAYKYKGKTWSRFVNRYPDEDAEYEFCKIGKSYLSI